MFRKKLEPKLLKDLSEKERFEVIKRCEIKWDDILQKIIPILRDVREKGDKALSYYSKKFDNVSISDADLEVPYKELKQAYNNLTEEEKQSIDMMKNNLSEFARRSELRSWSGKFYGGDAKLGKRVTAVSRAGVYVPGGKHRYSSTAMMAIVTAKEAGVKEIVVVTPPGNIDTFTLAAIHVAGAAECTTRVFKVGGAQAIAALAYGTESIPKVDIIVGPGNIYVNCAKRWLNASEGVKIDLPAGPSEILVIADKTANPEWVARDLFSQAEHDENACAVLVTDSMEFAEATYKVLTRDLLAKNDKNAIVARQSFKNFGAILVVDNLIEAADFANEFAAEHLEVFVNDENMLEILKTRIKHAGLISWGNSTEKKVNYAAVALSDYNLGTNHILPTGGAARNYSALSTEVFQKISMEEFHVGGKTLVKLEPGLNCMSKAEGLYNMHGLSVNIRLQDYRRRQRKLLNKKNKK